MSDNKGFILRSSDGKDFVVSEKAAFLCGVVQDMVKNIEGLDRNEPIPIQDVSGETLEKVVEWITHYEENPPTYDEEDRDASNIPEWDKEYLNVSQSVLFEIILAANYLNINTLLDYCCKAVALLIKGKNVEELRTQFGIKNDFTQDEIDLIRRENAWCED